MLDPEDQDDPDYCCEEHYPSQAMTPEEQLAHVCPVCSWSPTDDDDAAPAAP